MTIAITEQQKADLIPLLTDEVIHAFEKETYLAQFFNPEKIKNTDTKIDRVSGRAKVETIDWTEDDKHSQVGTFGTVEYKVEQSIYIRHAEKNIDVLISDINVLKELGMEHGIALALQRDVTIMAVLLTGALTDAMTATGVTGIDADNDLDKVIETGLRAVMDADGDINDVSKVSEKLEQMIIAQKSRRKFSRSETMMGVSYAIYNLLRQEDKLMDRDFSSENGDFAKGTIKEFMGVPLVPMPVFQDLQSGQPYGVGTDNPIGTTWNVTEAMAEARAVMFTPRAIRVLEVMAPTADAWYEKLHKVNYIDSQAFYGVGVRRQDHLGALFTYAASQLGTPVVDNLSTVGVV